jgi:peptidoglycan hydrolase-like protein with peptidoglycan-binding domain
MARWKLLGTAGGAVVVAGSVAIFGMGAGTSTSGNAAKATATLPKATAAVERGDLTDTETVDGTLGYGGKRSPVNGASGTVTGTRPDGTVVKRGKTLYEVDQKPVTLMYGADPMYRPLREGTSGDDVETLERNLDALGYGDSLTVDEEFTAQTAEAVREWQDDRGLPETGSVDAKQVIFASGAVRITDTRAAEGELARPGSPMVSVTGTGRKVTVDLDAADQQFAREKAKVTVELPGGETVQGKITEVGGVATVQKGSGEQEEDETKSTIEVEITLDDPEQTGKLDEAPVSVEMTTEKRENVLSVPVEALLALREGGYGLELVQGAGTRIVAVEIGLFAGGRVEVSGQGVTEGARVGVPAQ